jgi:MerR family transcriptional regulator, heat shock protein HspR
MGSFAILIPKPMEKTMKRKKGYFSISAVAEMFSVHQQTIRLYEREGLITPKRSEGNTRLFSEEDVNKLEEIIYLTHQLGINLAGVEMILKLQKKISKLQKEINGAFKTAQEELSRESIGFKQQAQRNAQRLAQLKQTPVLPAMTDKNPTTDHNLPANLPQAQKSWDIDYNE